MAKIIVIGSNSFSGAHFIDYLLSHSDFEVIGISRTPEQKDMYLPYRKNKNISRFRFHKFDLNKDMDSLLGYIDKEQPEYIVNYAALVEVGPSWGNPGHWFMTNALSVVKLSDHLKGISYLKRYVHISTPEVYGTCEGGVLENAPFNPSTPYAAAKASGDMFIQVLMKSRNFRATLIRSTNVYGPGQKIFKIVPRSIIYIKKGIRIPLEGGGAAVKSYIHITDVCDGTFKAMIDGEDGIYHFSPDSSQSIKEIVFSICRIMQKDFTEVTELVEDRIGQDAAYIINSEKARKSLGWKPSISLEKGLRECVVWVNNNWDELQTESLTYVHKDF